MDYWLWGTCNDFITYSWLKQKTANIFIQCLISIIKTRLNKHAILCSFVLYLLRQDMVELANILVRLCVFGRIRQIVTATLTINLIKYFILSESLENRKLIGRIMKTNRTSQFKVLKICPRAPPAGSVFAVINDYAARGHICPTQKFHPSSWSINLLAFAL